MRIKMPAVRIAQADAEASCQDTLTCGACSKTFSLADIVRFIQHKVLSCSAPINNNNNNNSAIANSNNSKDGYHSDSDGGGGGGVVSSRRPSISAPISTRKAVANTSRLQHQPLSPTSGAAAGVSPPLLSPPPPSSTPKRRSPGDDHEDMMLDLDDPVDTKPPRIKLEATDSSPDLDAGAATAVKRCRADVADAESNTTHSEPTNYVCCTCKQRVHSAWRLLQHAQTCHGIRLYVTDNTTSSPTKAVNTSSSSSTSSSCSSSSSNCSSASGNGAGGAGTCLPPPPGASSLHHPLPPTSVSGSRAALHHPSSSPLEHHLLGLPSTPPQLGSTSSSSHPFGVGGLLRSLAPGSDRVPPAPTAAAAPPPPFPAGLFARPSSHHEHHFRMEQLVQEQLRLNPLAAAAAVAAAAASAPGAPHLPPPPTSHNPFAPVPPLPLDRLAGGGGQTSSAPGTPRGVDPPQMDFYSQRLRQLAGTTSPGSAVVVPSNSSSTGSPSPRKPLLTPPFASPSPVPALNSSGGSNSPHHQQQAAAHNDSSPVLDAAVNNNNAPQPPSTPPSKVQQSSDDGSALQNQNRSSSPGVSRACEFCGKKFRFQSNLIVHRRTHTGEKPYKCAVCNHACTQSSKLKRHMKIHRHSAASAVTRSTGENGELSSADATPSANNNNNNNSNNTTPENASRTGSVEPLDEDGDDEDEDDDEEDDDDEEEEEEEEMELEEEEDDDDDDDLGGDGDAPEDLTTKSTSSTPPNHIVSSTGSDKTGGGGGDNGTPRLAPPTPSPLEKIATSGSLVGELMDKFGLSNIQQYSEAYKQALQESVVGPHHHHLLHIKDEFLHHRSPLIMDNNNQSIGKPPSASSLLAKENGFMEKSAAAMRFREEFAKNMMAAGQPPLDLMGAPHGLFGAAAAAAAAAAAFDSANPFDAATKRLKLDLDAHLPHHGSSQRSDRAPSSGSADAGGGNGGLYAGLWLPAMAAAAHHRDHLFGGGDTMDLLANHRSSKDSATAALLKASAAGGGGKAGPSASTLAAALNLGMPPTPTAAAVAQQQQIKKENRRNDTCEFCGKVFKNCSNLTVHRRSHTGEKPYKCELCSYACAQSSKLTRHMKTHGRLGKDVYRCRFCEMPFSVPSTLEKHMRKCVVNQNSKSGGGQHMLVSAGEDTGDSSASATKDAT